jgi:omega-hydroxy-beta-dihydromenaquinone-9 sulfotransferase
MFLVVALLILYFIAIKTLPFPHWPSYLRVLKCVIWEPNVSFQSRLSMFLYLVRDFLVLPVFSAFWLIDEIFFGKYKSIKIKAPLFIMSQPRSGTTFLLRTLSRDQNTFLSLKHLEWRYPYISLWKLIDALNLRSWLENKSYWPNTPLGRKSEKIHHHVLGSVEEFGIFFEERFYHHYFVFRRFPFPKVLDFVTDYKKLDERTKERFAKTFAKVVKKVYYFRGADEIFLTKENEAVALFEILFKIFPDARFLFIAREPEKFLNSYQTMSLACTEVKHGVNPMTIVGWQEANMQFRLDQCREFISFQEKVRTQAKNVLITYNQYTNKIYETTLKIYKALSLEMSDEYKGFLVKLQKEQDSRNPGYRNEECNIRGFEFFNQFVKNAESLTVTETPQISQTPN